MTELSAPAEATLAGEAADRPPGPSPLPAVPGDPGWTWTLGEAAAWARHVFRWLVAIPIYRLGLLALYRRWRRRRLPEGELQVVRYHRVIPDGERETVYPLGVRRRSFADQMAFLARRHRVVTPASAREFLEGGDPSPGMRVLVTLDDGYRDNLTEGLPGLQAAGMRSLIFITTDHVASGTRFPWERLKRVVQDTTEPALPLPGGGTLPLGARWSGRRRTFWRLLGWLESMPRADREAVLSLWEAPLPPPERNDGPLSWDEVRTLARAGQEIGAHTVRHPFLTRLDDGPLAEELGESRRRLEEELGAPLDAVAYPAGDHDDRVLARTEAAGYRLGFTTQGGTNPARAPRLQIRRKGIGPATAETPFGGFSPSLFAVEVAGFYDHLLRRQFP